jgi:hypothetical protein
MAIGLLVFSFGLGKTNGEGCGALGSVRLSEPEYLAREITIERHLFDGEMTHCQYALARACLAWETEKLDAAHDGFEMAFQFCEDKSVSERGQVAASLAAQKFPEAYSTFLRHSSASTEDSLLLAVYAPAAYSGLTLTSFSPRGPEAYRLPPGKLSPDLAWKLSVIPGLGFLYIGEPKVAASHFFLSTGFAALASLAAYHGITASHHDTRMVAWMDLGLISSLFLQRYYLGGMKEARRMALEKNRREGLQRVGALTATLDPFSADGQSIKP